MTLAESDNPSLTQTLLYLDGVSVSFDGYKALRSLSLILRPGEMRAIIGPNGAGKTTMMDVITGKTRPDEGEVMFDGRHDLTKLDEAEIAILKLESFSFILQNFYMKELAENYMVQLLVRDAAAWWQRVNGPKLMSEFDVKEPRAPIMQSWGMKVGFLFDPSGVLWHVAEVAF